MALHDDAWCGYPRSLHRLLVRVFEERASHLVFLSGDEHVSCIARVAITCDQQPGKEVVVNSIHSSALYAPFPFANSRPEDFAVPDQFDFDWLALDGAERHYRCEVSIVRWSPGDGFALLRPLLDEGRWCLKVRFDRAGASTDDSINLG